MSSNKALRKAKHSAFQKKQEKRGREIIVWIFGGLILLAIIFMIYTAIMV
jgi:hypothetical protein